MASKRHRQPLEVMANLNITNLLDTAFILLITFMLIAPQLTHGVKVKLPPVSDPQSLSPEDSSKTVTIFIEKLEEGRAEEIVSMSKGTEKSERVAVEDLRKEIEAYRTAEPDLTVIVKADRDSRSGVFAEVLTAVSKAGVDKIGIRTVPKIDKN